MKIHSILLAIVLVSGQIQVQIGSDCSTAEGDEFGCQGSNFLTCAGTKWTLQNSCPGSCLENPSFQSQCFLNSLNRNRPESTTNSDLDTPSTESIGNTDGSEYNGLSPFVIIVIIIGAIAALLLFVFIFVKFGKKGQVISSSEEKGISPVGVLQRLYVVVKSYDCVRSDEVMLSIGDHVELYILYNDGWAKGYNMTTGMSGLIPVTHLELIPVDNERTKIVSTSMASVHSNLENGRRSYVASLVSTSSSHSSIQVPVQNKLP